MYWSDCASPTTIHTARIEDEGDHRILITGNNKSCIVGIAIDFDGILLLSWSSQNLHYKQIGLIFLSKTSDIYIAVTEINKFK